MVTTREVRRLAVLAGLELTTAEAAALAGELDHILDHMEALAGEIPVRPDPASDAAPHVPPSQRTGAPEPEPVAERLPDMAPVWADGWFTVPRSTAGPPDDGA